MSIWHNPTALVIPVQGVPADRLEWHISVVLDTWSRDAISPENIILEFSHGRVTLPNLNLQVGPWPQHRHHAKRQHKLYQKARGRWANAPLTETYEPEV